MKEIEGSDCGWPSPARMPTLSDAVVHVWRARLDRQAAELAAMERLLSPDEWSRADHFRFDRDRCQFIAARATLRVLLGGYLDIEPAQLRFHYSPQGKPALTCTSKPGPLSFNLSHSHAIALYAVAYNRPLGIDLERIRQDVPYEQIARHVLSPRENAALHAFPAECRHQAFTSLWTCKEAYAKATGKGLTASPDQLDVTLALGESPQSPSSDGAAGGTMRWSLVTLAPGAGYAGALVAAGFNWRMSCWQWPGKCPH